MLLAIDRLRVANDAGHTLCRLPNLELEHGDKRLITGPNGSGKTTLLRCIAGFQEFQAENYEIAETQKITYVHQQSVMFKGTVADNLLIPLRYRRLVHSEQQRQLHAILDLFAWPLDLEKQASMLSGGEKRRVAILRALLSAPSLLLLDEPFSDIDANGAEQLATQLLSDRFRSVSILMTAPALESLPKSIRDLTRVTLTSVVN